MFYDEPILSLMLAGILLLFPSFIFGLGLFYFKKRDRRVFGFFIIIACIVSMFGVIVMLFVDSSIMLGLSIYGISLIAILIISLIVATFRKFKKIYLGEVEFSIKPVIDFLFDPMLILSCVLAVLFGIAINAPKLVFIIFGGGIFLASYLTFLFHNRDTEQSPKEETSKPASLIRYLIFLSLQTLLLLIMALILLTISSPFNLAYLLSSLIIWTGLSLMLGYAEFEDTQKMRSHRKVSYGLFTQAFLILISILFAVFISDNALIGIVSGLVIWFTGKKWTIPNLNSFIHHFIHNHISFDDENMPKPILLKGLFTAGYVIALPVLWMGAAVYLDWYPFSTLSADVMIIARKTLFIFSFVFFVLPWLTHYLFSNWSNQNIMFWLGLALSLLFQVMCIEYLLQSALIIETTLWATASSLITLIWILKSGIFQFREQ